MLNLQYVILRVYLFSWSANGPTHARLLANKPSRLLQHPSAPPVAALQQQQRSCFLALLGVEEELEVMYPLAAVAGATKNLHRTCRRCLTWRRPAAAVCCV